MEFIDSILAKYTVYRLTLYCLIGILSGAMLLSLFGVIHFSFWDIFFSSLTLLLSSFIFNFIFAGMFEARTSYESVTITALILALIFPLNFKTNFWLLVLASLIAIASKYLLTVERRHLFNPAAVAAVALPLITGFSATWWVGTPAMLPLVIIGGFLIARKFRREKKVLIFLITFLLGIAAVFLIRGQAFATIFTTWQHSLFASALFFFAFVMFTEPKTSPVKSWSQNLFAIITAILYASPQLRLFNLVFTPETALVLGNVYAFIAR